MIDPKIVLPTSDMPRHWYNLAADLPSPPPPPLGPDGRPIGPEMLAPVFPMNLIEQEMCCDRWEDIPEGILDIYARCRQRSWSARWRCWPVSRSPSESSGLETP